MQHDRIKYQERVMNEIQDKSKFAIQGTDDEFERKIQELQEKSQKKEENE